jgi:hypothetical protein
MRSKKSNNSKNTKFVRIDNSTWIEADIWVPDEVARMQFLQKVQITRPGSFAGQVNNDNFFARS